MLPVARVLPLCLLTLATSGCFFHAPTLGPLERDLTSRALRGAEVENRLHLRVGRLTLALARAAITDDEGEEDGEQIAAILQAVKGVEVAITEFSRAPADRERFASEIRRVAERRGWVTAAQVSEADSTAAVYFERRGEEIRSVYVMALDDNELVLARFRGRLDQAIAEAIAAQGGALPRELAGQSPTNEP